MFYVIFWLSVVTCLFALTLAILIGALGFSGSNNNDPISATCTSNYFIIKYTNILNVLVICFVYGLVSAVMALLLVTCLCLKFLRAIRGRKIYIGESLKYFLYVCCSLMISTVIVPTGYFLTYYKEVPSCQSAITSFTNIQVIYVIGFL